MFILWALKKSIVINRKIFLEAYIKQEYRDIDYIYDIPYFYHE
jgi:hypothetical protein